MGELKDFDPWDILWSEGIETFLAKILSEFWGQNI